MRSSLLVSAALLAGCGSGPFRPEDEKRGGELFAAYCAACHGPDGRGLESQIPPLAGSSWVTGPESRPIRIVLHGLRGPIDVGGEIFELEMPGFGPVMSDREIASVLTFVRRKFGKTPAINEASVRRVRAATGERTEYWTADELRRQNRD